MFQKILNFFYSEHTKKLQKKLERVTVERDNLEYATSEFVGIVNDLQLQIHDINKRISTLQKQKPTDFVG